GAGCRLIKQAPLRRHLCELAKFVGACPASEPRFASKAGSTELCRCGSRLEFFPREAGPRIKHQTSNIKHQTSATRANIRLRFSAQPVLAHSPATDEQIPAT